MKEFIFLLSASSIPLPQEQTQQLRQQWGKLITRLREDQKFVEGYIFSPSGHTIYGSPGRKIDANISTSQGRQTAGCVIIRAADKDEALMLAQFCPILDFGGSVEVQERIPQPQPAATTP